MKTSGFMVYWVDITGDGFFPFHSHFEMNEIKEALSFTEILRNNPDVGYVTLASQNPDSVGKPGVSDKLPTDYSWSKAHRAGAERGIPHSIIDNQSNK